MAKIYNPQNSKGKNLALQEDVDKKADITALNAHIDDVATLDAYGHVKKSSSIGNSLPVIGVNDAGQMMLNVRSQHSGFEVHDGLHVNTSIDTHPTAGDATVPLVATNTDGKLTGMAATAEQAGGVLLAESLDDTRTQYDNIVPTIAQVKTALAARDQAIADANASIATKANASDLTTHADKPATADTLGHVKLASSIIATDEDGSVPTLGQVRAALGAHTQAITDANDEIATKANASDLATHTNKSATVNDLGHVKLGESNVAVSAYAGKVCVDENGRMSVRVASRSVPGVVKLASDTKISAGANVQLNSNNQMLVPAATTSAYGSVKIGTSDEVPSDGGMVGLCNGALGVRKASTDATKGVGCVRLATSLDDTGDVSVPTAALIKEQFMPDIISDSPNGATISSTSGRQFLYFPLTLDDNTLIISCEIHLAAPQDYISVGEVTPSNTQLTVSITKSDAPITIVNGTYHIIAEVLYFNRSTKKIGRAYASGAVNIQ